MRKLRFPLLLAAASAWCAGATASVVEPCQSARQAIAAGEEAGWILRCAAIQRRPRLEAEDICRQYLARCRAARPSPTLRTY
jgi:hypothetical protein